MSEEAEQGKGKRDGGGGTARLAASWPREVQPMRAARVVVRAHDQPRLSPPIARRKASQQVSKRSEDELLVFAKPFDQTVTQSARNRGGGRGCGEEHRPGEPSKTHSRSDRGTSFGRCAFKFGQ